MHYDVIYRFNEALDPRALTTLPAALHAVNAAIRDCEQAGRSLENDAAVLRLVRHLGEVARGRGGSDADLEKQCRAERDRLIDAPPLLALRGQHLGHHLKARSTFHHQARRALRLHADELGLDPRIAWVGSRLQAAGDSGDSFLDHPDLLVMVVPWSGLPDHEVAFYRRRDRADAGFPMHHVPLPVLLDPAALAREIVAAIGPDPSSTALSAAA